MSGLAFQVGARTIATLPRRIVKAAASLEDVLAGRAPALPPLGPRDDGWLLLSVPDGVAAGTAGLAHVRQRYVRRYVDFASGEAEWRAALSGQTRAKLKRKRKKLAEAGGRVAAYRSAAELAAFHPLARAVSATTYQERLLDAGLPEDAAALSALAADDGVRAWLLFVGDAPAAYLCCTAQGAALRYDHVGHDPRFAALSPGTVLMEAALAASFADRFRWFDFTEGDGQHKRLFASGGVACHDLLLLRTTWANRLGLAALAGWDGAMAWAKARATGPVLGAVARRVRRA